VVTYKWSMEALEQALGNHSSCTEVRPILRHSLKLQSSYLHCLGREPAYTSANIETAQTVDYIAYTPKSGPLCPMQRPWEVQPVAVLDVPPFRSIRGGCPNPSIPSDHVCLLADYDVVPV
jgi:hypothetical protein